MMKIFFLMSAVFILVSCKSRVSEKPVSLAETPAMVPLPAPSATTTTDGHYFWESDLDAKEGLVVRRSIPVTSDSLTPSLIIAKMNETFPEIPLRFSFISNDTIFVKVANSLYLTQQMGSSGPEAYIAEAVYNLTEMPAIHYVHIAFTIHDHGAPGTYSRTDFTMR